MLSHLLARTASTTRGRLFWALLGGMVFLQLAAVWTLCSQQVSRAEARVAGLQLQKVALNDCLKQIPHATLSSCIASTASAHEQVLATASVSARGGREVLSTSFGGSMPAHFTFR